MSVYDKDKARLSFDRAAHRYDKSAKLQQQVANQLIKIVSEHCDVSAATLDIGCGTGQVTEAMCRQYPQSDVVGLDFSERMLAQTKQRLDQRGFAAQLICADAEQLPFHADSFDLIVSSLMLQWSNNLSATLAACHSVLKDNGIMVFNTFTEGTLTEVKQSWQAVDQQPHTSQFLSKELLQATVESVGFSQVEILYDTITMTYPSVREMIMEMKQIGASNAHKNRGRGLTGKQRFSAFEQAFESFRLDNREYPCTWKLAYIVCYK